jgi:hypothetical protein
VCPTADFNTDPESSAYKTMLAWYLSYWIRLVGMFDTILHVCRKKFNRVTTIHIFYYTTSIIYFWVHTRFAPQGPETIDLMFIVFNQSIAHFYYMLSSMGSDIRPYLWWKQHLITFQTAQGLPILEFHIILVFFFVIM